MRGGIARYGTHLLRALQKRHECLGVGFKKLYPAWLFPGKGELDEDAMPTTGAQAQRLLHYAWPQTWWEAERQIKKYSPNAVILTWWVSFWAPHMGWLARRVAPTHPVIFLCHNVLPHESRFFDPPLTRWALQPARGFIVHSGENRCQLLNWFPCRRVVQRQHPVYLAAARFAVPRDEARRRLGITGKMLLFFGFVRPYKGLDVALEALAQLESDLKDLTLWVSGEFWDDERGYRRLIARLNLNGRVRIESGFLSDEELALRLSACDGVILPYKSATGSGALATAYALDRPVIATRCGGFQEAVIPGQTGILCSPGDARSLAQAIQSFYALGGPARFQAGVARAKATFSWDAIVDAVEELLSDG